MKNLFFILIGIAIFASCQHSGKKVENTDEQLVLTVDDIQEKGYDLVGKEVLVAGTISHVCEHSGQRCFLMGSNEDVTIRVEAGHQIGSFNQEQMGSDLTVKGVLQEIRIDDAYVAGMEAEMKAEAKVNDEDHAIGHKGNHEIDGGDHSHEQAEQIAAMKQKIEATGKGYYSIFYLEGISAEEKTH